MTFDRKPVIEQIEDYVPDSFEIVISGRNITVYEMSLSALENAAKIAEPYLANFLQVFQSEGFVEAVKGEVDIYALVQMIMETLRKKLLAILADAPTALLRAVGCMMNADPDDDQMLDILRNATPKELMELLDRMGELNDFKQILMKLTEIVDYLKRRHNLEDEVS